MALHYSVNVRSGHIQSIYFMLYTIVEKKKQLFAKQALVA